MNYNDEIYKQHFMALEKTFINENEKVKIDNDNLVRINDMCFYKVKGMSSFWENSDKCDFNSIMSDILGGLAIKDIEITYLLINNSYIMNIYIGISKEYSYLLSDSLYASYPLIELEKSEQDDIEYSIANLSAYGGIIVGNPTNKIKDINKATQIEKVCKGLIGRKWCYIVTAKCISEIEVEVAYNKILNELKNTMPNMKYTISGIGTNLNSAEEVINYDCKKYIEDLEILNEKIQFGRNSGMWKVNCYYTANEEEIARKLGKLLKVVFSGEESKPERIKDIWVDEIENIFKSGISRLENKIDKFLLTYHPLKDSESFIYRYQNTINSKELAIFCQLPREEVPGYYINDYVKFDVAERKSKGNFKLGNIVYGNNILQKSDYKIDINSLTRHGLIIGMTGGGKTNTSKSIFSTLWLKKKKPFLVIESAKREYWQLGRMNGFEDLMLFTLGDDSKNAIKYRINPFERVGNGTTIQTHIDYILSTFKASFELYPPMPYVLETCVYRIYEDRGWDVLNDINILGREDYPTLDDLYYKIEIVVDELGYDNKIASDVKAALKARIKSLLIGGKGAMLNTPKSVPIGELLKKPVVFELEDIGDDDVKAFLMGIILIQIYENRKSDKDTSKDLKHVILVEEAHRLLKNVSSGGDSANPRGKAVEFFCNLLAEIRSYGQGILIADQVPTKLAPDTLKNTNLKITHRIVTEDDRNAIGKAMNMNSEQIDYISTLKTGFAAVYSEGDNRPKIVKMPLMEDKNKNSREEIMNKIRKTTNSLTDKYIFEMKNGPGCSYCIERCLHQNKLNNEYKNMKDYIDNSINSWNKQQDEISKDSIYSRISSGSSIYLKKKLSFGEALCILNYILENINIIEENIKRQIVSEFIRENGE